ncbi:MAG: sialidase family protein, partial [bacterium]
MKHLVLIATICFAFAQNQLPNQTYNFSYPKVLTATQEVLNDMNVPIKMIEDGIITFEPIEVDIVAITEYIEEDMPVDKPGWEKARLFLTFNLQPINSNQTTVSIEIKIERFGVPHEFLLIPPAWTPVASNGVLEEIILSAIGYKLSPDKFRPLKRKIQGKIDEMGSGNEYLPAFHLDPPFIPNVAVSNDPGTGNQNETTIGIFGGNYVCGGWNDSRLGVYHVGFAFSTDGGLNWSDDTVMIEPSYPNDGDPVICIDDSGTVYYFWLSFSPSYVGDIFLTKSYDGGVTWGPFVCVTPNSPTSLDDKPWATIDGDNIYVTWYEYGTTSDLKFTRSTDRGATWSTGVSVGRGGNGTTPFRGTDSTIYVGWGMQDVKLNKSTDMGRTWQGQDTIINVTWSPGSTPWRVNNIPCFKTNNDRTKLYVVFADSRLRTGQLDVFFSKSTNQGETWSTPVKVNDTPSGDTTKQFYPWMAVDPYDRIHVVWHDTREEGGRLAQYYAYSTDLGNTWSSNYRASDTAVYASTFIGDYTACAADNYYVYALWCDARTAPGNPDIFFSKAMHQQNRDVGVQSIVSPGQRIPSMIPVNVEATIKNFGFNQETFPATALITLAGDTIFIKDTTLSLDAAQEDTVLFGEFTPDSNLVYNVMFRTALVGDENPLNDTASSKARTTPDAGVSKVIRPKGKVIPAFPADAEAMIKNFSGDPKDVPATLVVKDTITG